MRHRLSLLVVIGIVIGGTGAFPQSASIVRRELTADYARIARSFEKRDTRAIMALGAPDFTMKMGHRVLNARQAEQELKRETALIGTMRRVVMNVQNLQLEGKRAIATVAFSFAGTIRDDRGRRHAFTLQGVTRDTWVKTPRGWRIQRLDTVRSRSTMDGRLMQ